MIGYICWLWASAAQRRQRTRLLTEFNGKLLDKLGSVNDFSQFLQTDAGARFMRDLASEPVPAEERTRDTRDAGVRARARR